MQTNVILRNTVCAASVSPTEFDVDSFAERLDLGVAEDKVLVGDFSITEWKNARLQILPDRLQLGFKEGADSEMILRVADDFLGRVDDLAPDAPIDFNAGLMLTLEAGDKDPSERLLNAEVLASALGGAGGRGGVTLVYHDELSRWWIELTPEPDEERKWIYDFNRQFVDFPDSGGMRGGILSWFADIDIGLVAQFETMTRGSSDGHNGKD